MRSPWVGALAAFLRCSSACAIVSLTLCSGCSDESVVAEPPEPLRCPDAPVIHSGEATFYFIEPSGMGPGPYTFRVTDLYGHVLVDSAIALVVDGDVSGHAQFPQCGP